MEWQNHENEIDFISSPDPIWFVTGSCGDIAAPSFEAEAEQEGMWNSERYEERDHQKDISNFL